MHQTVNSPILYFGTPVIIISSLNDDGSCNLAPVSSAFWLGWRCILGLATHSRTPQNMKRTRECVLNLPSIHQTDAVNRLALTTGSNPVPEFKLQKGYRHVQDKFALSGLTGMPSETVAPPRIGECPVQLEAVVEAVHPVAADSDRMHGFLECFEVRIQRVHVESDLLMAGHTDRIDPDKWRPLIMSFQRFYGLGPELQHSALSSIPEASYRSPDMYRSTYRTTGI